MRFDESDRSRSVQRLEALVRYSLLHTSSRFNGSVLVTEFPKCGGTWLSMMLADTLGLEFPRNRFPGLKASIFQGHYIYKFSGVKKVVVWRDPRDMMVSWYHHSLFKSETNSSSLIRENRDAVGFSDYENVQLNLHSFIEYCFTRQRSPRFTWNQFYDAWSAPRADVLHTSYETLRHDPKVELDRLSKQLGVKASSNKIASVVDRYSFETLSGRKAGEERKGTFLRKGLVGDWQNVFDERALEVLENCTEGRVAKYSCLMNDLGLL